MCNKTGKDHYPETIKPINSRNRIKVTASYRSVIDRIAKAEYYHYKEASTWNINASPYGNSDELIAFIYKLDRRQVYQDIKKTE